MLYRRHVLVKVLLLLLLFTKLSNLEHLKPALVAKDFCTELDHLTVDRVVRWDVCNKPCVTRLKV